MDKGGGISIKGSGIKGNLCGDEKGLYLNRSGSY